MSEYLSIQHIQKQFDAFTALKDISFTVQKNEFVCLLGPSGCGKTTLLRILAGLEEPTAGSIAVNGKDITALPPGKRNLGMVFQSYALFPNLTALENIEYGLKTKRYSKAEVKEKAIEALELVDLLNVKDKYPAQMSGGQQQRVALARALALSPDILLLDEPLSALDAKVREKLRREMRELQEKVGVTTIMVTHDQEEALTMADKIVVMNHAEIMQIGTPQEIYQKPSNPFVADFIGSINFFSENDRKQAIRPEHVVIVQNNGMKTVVENMEFRGSVYRTEVRVIEEDSHLYNERIVVDILAMVAEQNCIRKGKPLQISFSENHMLSYGKKVIV
ncbi:putative 2-aminoethylphosphonate ABC transporter ATP-binding protein [Bacillus cereus]|uniref:putative 2-aminoethylphosphonate ABC transporter ATP-binding protein n=1 Tax=Bacillus cereus group TaxID=86661 RepID=UPI0002D55013|nr:MULTISPECIES: putative 2-aminoethylphosphonate ABC transporter ATP-binding protein [Bacillus cereus group]PFA18899.1 putative 2-aminoethylphosphonate ABC transporter ATP-binding protein [Bacillus cereus]PFR29098.1 putative 2-aminoethylphosphonate ABC transporter ATP-binding protein [Bacillus cereus]PGZ17335.1 putative 2-aminoethylphosphonate ABC transporter ATP-binding protein [Bacillus cereus]